MTREEPPDLHAIIGHSPLEVRVIYRGTMYRWMQCGYAKCMRWFWKNVTERSNKNPRAKAVYCSTDCRVANTKILTRERQRRWRERQAKGLITTT